MVPICHCIWTLLKNKKVLFHPLTRAGTRLCSKLICFFYFNSDQVRRRHYWHSVDWLHRVTRECGISGTKDRLVALQRLNHLSPRYSFFCCQDDLQPTTIEVLYLKQQCWIMAANHIPWWRSSNLKGRCWQDLCAHQGRQLPIGTLNQSKELFLGSVILLQTCMLDSILK